MTMSTSEWGDFPTSSELFGSDFFGDELMDIYTNSNDDTDRQISSLLDDSDSPHDDEVSNGMLVAMNAAAMDGGLFGSSSEFIPANVSSASLGTQPAPTPAPVFNQAPAAASPKVSTAHKRTITSEAGQLDPAAKKPKAAPATYVVNAPAPVSAATRAGPLPSGATSAAPAVTPGSVPATIPSITVPTGRVTTAATVVPASHGSVKMSHGGVAHQVVPRPYAGVANTAGPRRAPTATVPTVTSAAKTTGIVPQHSLNKLQVKPAEVVSSGVRRTTTEADFKNVASAAVTSLIQSASNGVSAPTKIAGKVVSSKVIEKPIDTSTAHVHALTSQSWITACSNPIPTPVASTNEIDKAARNARRAALTQEERAKQNRDRNREHARNTRLRKKAYVEELKRTLTEIVAQRDAAELEKMHSAQREREQREVRFRVMEEFLKLRGRNELNAGRWVAILEDGFTLTLPKTNFRQMVEGDNSPLEEANGDAMATRTDLEQVIRGAGPVMEDSQYLSNFLQTIGSTDHSFQSPQIQIIYKCDRKRFFMDGNVTFMDFAATTVGAVSKGLHSEIVFKGSMRSLFSPASNKLISVDITFDTGVITNQLEHLGHPVANHAPEDDAAEAAVAAANEADALLDSLQMPQIYVDKNTLGPASVSSDDGSNHS
ncbi:hypothetical protein HJC23_009977 [Cyclotella cryptica]|uniref:BZIP domain-containing protein n=1 Tax=Cyclotella cryptica TaxID=29204 RepID=A0ABD3Q8I8_9STRA|eukprot:CCRYP_007738-RA/>CCRYP_007738-RA protein AED:0.00 eAED:0.00 QI:825/-1/1/1/-1/1/1/321/656